MENANNAVDSILGENQDRLSEELQVARARLSARKKARLNKRCRMAGYPQILQPRCSRKLTSD